MLGVGLWLILIEVNLRVDLDSFKKTIEHRRVNLPAVTNNALLQAAVLIKSTKS